MAKSLPQRPNWAHLQREAKAILKQQRTGQAQACTVLRHLHRFARKSDREILASNVVLAEMQYALALAYGFESWKHLKAHVTGEETIMEGQYVVLLPDGTEHFVYDDLVVEAGGHVRSDFAEGIPGGDPRPFQGQPITIEFRVSQGRTKFSRTGDYHFAFYVRNADGAID